ncbi:hypothetical protein H5410_053919 [Solanum commersonii]|uniref:Uncharacterized protein n=1 Tax=Solanum commersonii TaxID=4109 RepID=A0A9J5X7R6_SOLCO|nr:hypothetical protein H5410_053919 [Solanum commersonii]
MWCGKARASDRKDSPSRKLLLLENGETISDRWTKRDPILKAEEEEEELALGEESNDYEINNDTKEST